ncbi:hypothetical protein BO94DRAFT_36425 [Aspergillus sclerotioniger CBS 115572]|uniref:Transmembrane protein n=1 Tax=Aspergillus sclerotioniger CBS 115572 TaxID=1450535 RepID=A0A317WVY0_9EURO|nr:hypothetical protein BO94DRAFT_36425 [Aspergillus sclerotioniger CBS 115572]PWY89462.1 hypothetical protein BO94DRAFT_36425 [Aspergillus sclerotioniger CBS 115572]
MPLNGEGKSDEFLLGFAPPCAEVTTTDQRVPNFPCLRSSLDVRAPLSISFLGPFFFRSMLISLFIYFFPFLPSSAAHPNIFSTRSLLLIYSIAHPSSPVSFGFTSLYLLLPSLFNCSCIHFLLGFSPFRQLHLAFALFFFFSECFSPLSPSVSTRCRAHKVSTVDLLLSRMIFPCLLLSHSHSPAWEGMKALAAAICGRDPRHSLSLPFCATARDLSRNTTLLAVSALRPRLCLQRSF